MKTYTKPTLVFTKLFLKDVLSASDLFGKEIVGEDPYDWEGIR